MTAVSVEHAAQAVTLLHQAFAAMQGSVVQPQIQDATIADVNTSTGKGEKIDLLSKAALVQINLSLWRRVL